MPRLRNIGGTLVLGIALLLQLTYVNAQTATAADALPKLAALSVQVTDPTLSHLQQKIVESLGSAVQRVEGYSPITYTDLLQVANKNEIPFQELAGSGLKTIVTDLEIDYYITGRVTQTKEGRKLILQLLNARTSRVEREVTVPYTGTVSSLLTVKLRDSVVKLFE